MSPFLHDLKYGARLLLKAPGFTAVAALSLALGIGANTTIFTLINAVLLNPLPVEEPSRLVSVFTTDQRNTGGLNSFLQTSLQNFKDYRDKNEVFSSLVAHQFVAISISGGTGEPQQTFGEIVSGDFFSALGVRPIIGRAFLADEDATPGAKLVTVLGYGLWQTRYGGDPGLVGRTVTLNAQAFTVVGIAPKGFRGTNAIGGPTLWVPLMTYQQVTSGFFFENFDTRRALIFNMTGRLKPGVTVQQADANLKTIARQLEQEYQNDNGGRNVTLMPLAQATINPALRSTFVTAGGLLMTIVMLVLLIACANVANLLLARAAVRQKEIAVRLSLGASRSRLVRQLLTEGTLLALVGGATGLLLAYWAQSLLWSFRPPFLTPDALDLTPDLRVLAFTAIISLATGVVFGLAPAVQASRPDLVVELKEKTSAPTGSNRLFGLRNLLVAAQVALSLVALIGAGLFLRSLQSAQRINPGFDSDKLLVLTFDPGSQGYDEVHGRELYRQALERAASIAGADGATIATGIPLLGGFFSRTVFLEGQDPNDRKSGKLVEVNPDRPALFQHRRYPPRSRTRLHRRRSAWRTDRRHHQRDDGEDILARPGRDRPPLQVFWPEQFSGGRRYREGQ
jgi:predicted permease